MLEMFVVREPQECVACLFAESLEFGRQRQNLTSAGQEYMWILPDWMGLTYGTFSLDCCHSQNVSVIHVVQLCTWGWAAGFIVLEMSTGGSDLGVHEPLSPMSLWLPCGLHGFAVPNTVTVICLQTLSMEGWAATLSH
jgi:hypothetical protein